MKRSAVAALVALCLAGGTAGAQTTPRLALFPTPLTPLTAIPPFAPPATALPNFFRPPISSRELVSVGIDEDGDVLSVKATQRLVLTRVGDYRLTVPAPATGVVAAPGSESSPGLRKDAVVWAGFSGGRKVLAATATLDPPAAAGLLPLKVTISDSAVRLENATTTRAATFVAEGDPKELAQVLDTLRRDPQGRTLGRGTYVKVRGDVREVHLPISAPLRVTGRVGGTDVSLVLGGFGRPTTHTIPVRGRPDVQVMARLVIPAALETPLRRPTWGQAVRISLTLARARQYQTFVANPDPYGPATARYVYRTVAAPAPPTPPPSTPDEGGLAAWLVALIVAGSVAALGGLAVLWANS